MVGGEGEGKRGSFDRNVSEKGIDWSVERPKRIEKARKLLKSCDTQHRLDVFWAETMKRFSARVS
jgi:hypothetical protein